MFIINTHRPLSQLKTGVLFSGLSLLLVICSFSSSVARNRSNLARLTAPSCRAFSEANQVLEWNQIFIDTLLATTTPNSSSQRLGAIVHTAMFDAYNGIEGRYTPILVNDEAPSGASRRAAVIAAAHHAGRTVPNPKDDSG